MGSPGIDTIEDAFEDTKDMLLPFDFKTWSLFAVIVLFAGHLALPTNFFMPSGDLGGEYQGDPWMNDVPQTSLQSQGGFESLESLTNQSVLSSVDTATLVIIALAFVGFFIIFSLIGSIFQFVLFASVNDKEPKLGYAKTYFKSGTKYFGYRILSLLLILVYVIATAAAASTSLWTLVITVPVGILAFIGLMIVDWIIFHITLPEIIYEDRGFIKAFKTSLSSVRQNLGDVAVFWLIKFILKSALGMGMFLIVALVGLILGIPLVLLGFAASSISIYLAVPVVIIGLVAGLALMLYSVVPIQVFLRSYILHFYEEIRN